MTTFFKIKVNVFNTFIVQINNPLQMGPYLKYNEQYHIVLTNLKIMLCYNT